MLRQIIRVSKFWREYAGDLAVEAIDESTAIRRIPRSWGKVGRNEDCPCGSGKKYKHCHGKYA